MRSSSLPWLPANSPLKSCKGRVPLTSCYYDGTTALPLNPDEQAECVKREDQSSQQASPPSHAQRLQSHKGSQKRAATGAADSKSPASKKKMADRTPASKGQKTMNTFFAAK